MVGGIKPRMILIIASWILSLSFSASAQGTGTHFEIGIVYYAAGDGFKALEKEPVLEGGRTKFMARVKGAHATLRLRTDRPQIFRVCGVDPTRFKLYRFTSELNARTLTLATTNFWAGRSKVVLSESEIPVAIEASESGCFALTPKEYLKDGEFSFSPVESLDAFTFGVGEVSQSDGKKFRYSKRATE
ncbi:MAG: hypothetical protein P4L40_08645 [Terracidiphilus sp.]|nr:hypothetical protein [Terracidiphilus sp.]